VVRALFFACVALAAAAPALGGGARGGVGPPFFLSSCRFSHMSTDDPIVWPGRPGYSHNHTFVGNVATNAFSTASALRRAGTTCSPAADTAAYWAPTLYVDGTPLAPATATIYYRRLTAAHVRPFPPGLEMVAGNSKAVRPQSTSITYWDCSVLKSSFYGRALRGSGAVAPSVRQSSIPRCPVKSQLQLHVNFPECWDGRHLESANHKSHMAYAAAGRCPADHPVPVPALSLVYRYSAPVVDAAHTVFLSSGGQYSGHADFINAWNQHAFAQLVESCLNASYCAEG